MSVSPEMAPPPEIMTIDFDSMIVMEQQNINFMDCEFEPWIMHESPVAETTPILTPPPEVLDNSFTVSLASTSNSEDHANGLHFNEPAHVIKKEPVFLNQRQVIELESGEALDTSTIAVKKSSGEATDSHIRCDGGQNSEDKKSLSSPQIPSDTSKLAVVTSSHVSSLPTPAVSSYSSDQETDCNAESFAFVTKDSTHKFSTSDKPLSNTHHTTKAYNTHNNAIDSFLLEPPIFPSPPLSSVSAPSSSLSNCMDSQTETMSNGEQFSQMSTLSNKITLSFESTFSVLEGIISPPSSTSPESIRSPTCLANLFSESPSSPSSWMSFSSSPPSSESEQLCTEYDYEAEASSIAKWSKLDVLGWLKRNKLNYICPSWSSLDGPSLQHLVHEYQQDPKLFYHKIKKALGLTVFEMMIISRSLKDLSMMESGFDWAGLRLSINDEFVSKLTPDNRKIFNFVSVKE